MPSPSSADLHINEALTNVSVAYIQDASNFLADKVFGSVPVQKRGDVYYKYSKSDWRRTDVQLRAPGTESAGTAWRHTTDNYYCDVYAGHKDIDDQDRANADSYWKLDKAATKFITNQLLLKREIDWVNKFFVTGVWGTELTGVSGTPTAGQVKQWDQAGSTPLEDVTDAEITFRESTGFDCNFLVLGARVWKALKNHPEILDRVKYTQKGQVTKALVAEFFEVENLYVAQASQATGPVINDAKAQDAAATYSYIANSKAMLLGYANPEPALETPSAGYTFKWAGYMSGNNEGIRIKNFRLERIESDRIEGSMTYDMKVVATDCGVFYNSLVS